MKEILLKQIKAAIELWDTTDIYVISLFVYDENDNPLEPTVTLGYNTYSNFQENIDSAWDESEAKWNYAYWLQNEEFVFGIGETKQIVQNWISKNAVSIEFYTLDEEESSITNLFIKTLVDIVKKLHSSGFIKEKFGKEIPIIIHELEYYDEIAEQNIEANGLELVQDFVDFCYGL